MQHQQDEVTRLLLFQHHADLDAQHNHLNPLRLQLKMKILLAASECTIYEPCHHYTGENLRTAIQSAVTSAATLKAEEKRCNDSASGLPAAAPALSAGDNLQIALASGQIYKAISGVYLHGSELKQRIAEEIQQGIKSYGYPCPRLD